MSRLTRFAKKIQVRYRKSIPVNFYQYYQFAPCEMVTVGSRPSPELIQRIKASYRRTCREYVPDTTSMWSIIDKMREPIHRALLADDDSINEYLYDPSASHLFYGLDGFPDKNAKLGLDVNTFDKFIRLCEALGVRKLMNPESGLPKKLLSVDVDLELDKICKALGVDDLTIANPFQYTYGLKTKRGVLNYRTVQCLYQAYRINQLGGKNTIEIGGGIGRTAYYSMLFGTSAYTIIDLPMTLVCQALFLGQTLGENRIRLDGEPDTGQPVQLLCPTNFPDSTFDVAFNADSLTEMSEQHAVEYAKCIKKQASVFLSINHEINSFTVSSIMGKPTYRFPYWLRKGYAEELYVLK